MEERRGIMDMIRKQVLGQGKEVLAYDRTEVFHAMALMCRLCRLYADGQRHPKNVMSLLDKENIPLADFLELGLQWLWLQGQLVVRGRLEDMLAVQYRVNQYQGYQAFQAYVYMHSLVQCYWSDYREMSVKRLTQCFRTFVPIEHQEAYDKYMRSRGFNNCL